MNIYTKIVKYKHLPSSPPLLLDPTHLPFSEGFLPSSKNMISINNFFCIILVVKLVQPSIMHVKIMNGYNKILIKPKPLHGQMTLQE